MTMPAKVTIYMRWYVGDYLNDTDHLSLLQHGAYSLLLMKMWQRSGWLPLDHDQLARLCRVPREEWDKIWPALDGYFLRSEGGLHFTQKRLLEEFGKAKTLCQVAVASGRRGGQTRVARHGRTKPGGSDPSRGPGSGPQGSPQGGAQGSQQPPSNGTLKEPLEGSSSWSGVRGQGSEERDPERTPPPSLSHCTGHDLLRWYGEERAAAVPGAMPWQVPKASGGKASSFASDMSAEAVADARPTMAMHFAELRAGKGKAGALEDPTLGFGCWCASLTRLREQLAGTVIETPRPGAGATPETRASVVEMARAYERDHG